MAVSTAAGASAAHSPIATSDLAPVATAAQARHKIDTSECRRPCARR